MSFILCWLSFTLWLLLSSTLTMASASQPGVLRRLTEDSHETVVARDLEIHQGATDPPSPSFAIVTTAPSVDPFGPDRRPVDGSPSVPTAATATQGPTQAGSTPEPTTVSITDDPLDGNVTDIPTIAPTSIINSTIPTDYPTLDGVITESPTQSASDIASSAPSILITTSPAPSLSDMPSSTPTSFGNASFASDMPSDVPSMMGNIDLKPDSADKTETEISGATSIKTIITLVGMVTLSCLVSMLSSW